VCDLFPPTTPQSPPSAVRRLASAAVRRPPLSAVRRPPSAAVRRPPSAVRRRPPPSGVRRPPPSAAVRRPPPSAVHRPPPSATIRRPPSSQQNVMGNQKKQLNPLKSVGEIDTLIRKIYPSVMSTAHTTHDDLEPPWVAPLTVSGKRLNAGRRRENHYARNVPMKVQLVLWVATLGPTSGPTSWTIDCAFLR
jgi:hypothetical protein